MPNDDKRFSFNPFRGFKAPTRKVWIGLGAVLALLILLTAPQAFVDVYNHTIHSGAGKDAALVAGLKVSFGIILVLTLQLGLLTLMGCLYIPRMIAAYKDGKEAVRRMPQAWADFKAQCSRARQAMGRAASSVGTALSNLPGNIAKFARKVRAMGLAEWLAFFAALGMIKLLAVLLFFNWGVAAHVQAWLPHWVGFSDDIMGRVVIDLFLSTFIWAIVAPIWMAICKVAIRFLVKRRQ